jgi:benzodiazapine receptor
MSRSHSKGAAGLPPGLVFFATIFVAQILSCTAAFRNIPTWYALLKRPEIYPPHLFFGPLWSLVFGLMAAAGAHLFRSVPAGAARAIAVVCIGVQAIVSAGWAEVFFALHSLDWALFVGLLLFAVAVGAALATNRAHPGIGLLLSPTLIWSGIALAANAGLYMANR